jgi:undecaprenyl-diphosphatase
VAIWEIVLLAVLQGLTEFLPVSSKTHLLFAQILMGWRDPQRNLMITVMLHAGSLLAVFVYYWREWAQLFRRRSFEMVQIVVASLPVVVLGLLFKDRLEALYGGGVFAGAMLVVTGGWLFLAERFGRAKYDDLRDVPMWRILLVGFAQACALLPGISRSGSTIGAAYLLGYARKDAVRFSFSLGTPVILGVILLKTRDAIRGEGSLSVLPILIGVAVTFAVSLVAIRVVEILSKRGKIFLFAAYCVAVGIAALLYFIVRG